MVIEDGSPMPMSKTITVERDDPTAATLDELVRSNGEPRDVLIARAIAAMQAHNDWVVARIAAGIKAADRGEFASDAEIDEMLRKSGTRS
jgi:predicted transcriptional regulator